MPGTGNPYDPADADVERDHTPPANTRPPLERLGRLGATTEDLVVAQERWAGMTEEERQTTGEWMDSLTDDELRAQIDEDRRSPAGAGAEAVPAGTVEEVLGWVGDDAARASAALEAEHAKDRPRVTLIEALEEIAG